MLDPGGDSDNNSITGNSCSTTIADSGDLSYFNYYNFTVGAAGLADLSVSSQDFLPTLYLLDDGGNVLATDSGGATASQSEIRLFLTPGNYTAQVFSPLPSGGAYSLAYQFPAAPRHRACRRRRMQATRRRDRWARQLPEQPGADGYLQHRPGRHPALSISP